ncbi:MAG TPA: hypothetical protein DCO82_09270 [Alphaproteobacteria bacterium]|nr:hypothetical protein [Alphaproteobacteria bacterium]
MNRPQQPALFEDDPHEAFRHMMILSGKSTKQVAAFLWPEMRLESAYAKLTNCLKDGTGEKLSFAQVIAAMNFCGSYEPLYYACSATDHHRPARMAAGEREAELAKTIRGAAETMEKAMRALERLKESGA